MVRSELGFYLVPCSVFPLGSQSPEGAGIYIRPQSKLAVSAGRADCSRQAGEVRCGGQARWAGVAGFRRRQAVSNKEQVIS